MIFAGSLCFVKKGDVMGIGNIVLAGAVLIALLLSIENNEE